MLSIIAGTGGAAVMAVGGITAIIAMLFLTYRAFTVRWYWGLTTLLIPFGFIPFTILNWKAAKTPFLTSMISLVIALCASAARIYAASQLPPTIN